VAVLARVARAFFVLFVCIYNDGARAKGEGWHAREMFRFSQSRESNNWQRNLRTSICGVKRTSEQEYKMER
jgi:hypothetical protein